LLCSLALQGSLHPPPATQRNKRPGSEHPPVRLISDLQHMQAKTTEGLPFSLLRLCRKTILQVLRVQNVDLACFRISVRPPQTAERERRFIMTRLAAFQPLQNKTTGRAGNCWDCWPTAFVLWTLVRSEIPMECMSLAQQKTSDCVKGRRQWRALKIT
jgi:hypothetical protein